MSRANLCLLLLSFAIWSTSGAVVIRADVDDSSYRIPASAFPALADLPDEGHGVLIAPRWIVTAAHATATQRIAQEVTIAGVARKVDRVVVYPGYTTLPEALVTDALASGDFSKAYAFLAATNDIALIRLASPVTDVTPMPLYRGNAEVGKTVQILGKGATGNGAGGQVSGGAHRTVLRRAFNVVAGADARYVWYRFDPPPSGLPLEGIAGGGDSGGPAIIEHEGLQQLAGLTSWNKYRPSNDHAFHPGLYGQIVYNVRISRYIQWIESVMSASKGCDALQRTQLPCADRQHP